MASSIFLIGGGNTSFGTASVTRFGGALNGSADVSRSTSSVEARVQGAAAVAGAISNLTVNVVTNGRTTDTIYGIRLNGAAALSVTYTSGQTGVKTDATSVPVAQDDLLASFITTSTGTGNFNVAFVGVRFDATSGTLSSLSASSNILLTLSGTGPITDFIPLAGELTNASLVETDCQINATAACTAKYLQMAVDSNARTTDTVVTFRNNGAAGNQTFTYTSGQTGLKKDAVNTDVIAAGNKFCVQVALGTGTGNFIPSMVATWFDASVAGESILATARGNGQAYGTATMYGEFGGRLSANNVESNIASQLGTAGTLSKMGANVLTNASSATVTLALRKNTTNGNQSFTVGVGQTGFFEDSTNSDAFLSTDTIDFAVSGATTSTITFSAVYAKLTTASSAPFFKDDWPNPPQVLPYALLATEAQILGSPENLTLLAGQDTIFGARGQVPDYDWPNPVRLGDLAPGITSQPSGAPRILNLLVGQDALPHRWRDWPNPTLLRMTPSGVTSQPLGSTRIDLLTGKDKLPFRNDYLVVAPTLAQPRAIPIGAQMMGSPRLENLLVGKDALPFRQNDWPLPRGAAYDRAINSQMNGMPESGLSPAAPFAQRDWPNPTLRLSHMQALIAQAQGAALVLNTLVGQDTFFGAPGQVLDYDWPVPVGPPKWLEAISSQPLGAPAPVTFGTAAPFAKYDWPNPLLPAKAPDTQPQGSPENLTLLPGQDKLPDRQNDWPDPVRGISPFVAISAQPSGSPVNLTLLPGKDSLPIRQQDWPNPRLSVSHVAAISAQVLGQSVPIEEAEEATAQYDWPVPRGAQQPVQTQPIGSPTLLTLLPGRDQLPIRQRDWPNPTLGKSAYAADTGQLLGSPLNLTTLVGQDALPFNQDQWPNPRLRNDPLPPTPLGAPDNVTLLPGQDAFPVRQQNWPVPRGPIPAIQTQPLGIPPLQLTPATPIAQDDWPAPRGPQPRTQTQPLGCPSLLTLLPGQDRLPVRQQDWPVMRGAIIPPQTQPLGVPLLLLSPVSPFSPLAWPNPRGPVPPVQTQPYGSPRLLNLLVGRDALPVRQQEWPNPIRPRQPTLTQPLGVLLSPLAPFFQTDWPNPILPVSRIAALGAQALGRVISVATPFQQSDWPNPLRPADRHPAVTAQQLGGVTRPSFPSVAPQGPNPVLAISPWAAIGAQPVGCPSVLTLYPGQDFLPFRQNEWPVPPGPPPRTQTQRQGVSPNQRRPAPPAIINKPPMTGTETPISLAASEVAPTLLGSEVPVNLSATEDQANLAGEKSSADLSGEVDQ